MRRTITWLFFLTLFTTFGGSRAHAGEAVLLLGEPYGHFGGMNPTGHAAVYLSEVCANTPIQLRRCGPGETGIVLSRYESIDGYDWLAMPLIPYLCAVDDPSQIPDHVDARLAARLRDRYRREHLLDVAPDDAKKEIPGGNWIELIGAAYDRKIYGLAIETRSEQDDSFIDIFNDQANIGHFNLFFNNCANFAEKVMNFYYPHSIHRNFIADGGLMTPKQAAKSLTKYSKRHPELEFTTFVIPQVPGTIHRSTGIDGIAESLLKSKRYVLPLAYLHPVFTATLVAAYFGGGGRFHFDPHAAVFDPAVDLIPGIPAEHKIAAADPPDPSEMDPAPSSLSDSSPVASLFTSGSYDAVDRRVKAILPAAHAEE